MGLLFELAKVGDAAARTILRACLADVAAVQDKPVVRMQPVLCWHGFE
jgi:N-acetylglucosamine kinase-like BadF-type ATPase